VEWGGEPPAPPPTGEGAPDSQRAALGERPSWPSRGTILRSGATSGTLAVRSRGNHFSRGLLRGADVIYAAERPFVCAWTGRIDLRARFRNNPGGIGEETT